MKFGTIVAPNISPKTVKFLDNNKMATERHDQHLGGQWKSKHHPKQRKASLTGPLGAGGRLGKNCPPAPKRAGERLDNIHNNEEQHKLAP